ncbi:MAG: GNAT family N-acetyltransferase [Bacteroidota bacterium]|nr:GNAT family N-acetyltransferase [Flavisolibacter sp.]MDQ3842487.1 GNAT family N-acetyltransferase [Bacteroidota bacterium]
MNLIPIHIDEDKAKEIYANPDCQEIFKSYPDYYYKAGYNPPWIGYFVIRDNIVVGVGGFIGQPKDGKVEIAYGTFKAYEGQGIASFTCKQLISIAKTADPKVIITAKTSPEHNASTKILERNRFEFTGTVQDEGIGDAWEWVLKEGNH